MAGVNVPKEEAKKGGIPRKKWPSNLAPEQAQVHGLWVVGGKLARPKPGPAHRLELPEGTRVEVGTRSCPPYPFLADTRVCRASWILAG